jgi:hypothetical protein
MERILKEEEEEEEEEAQHIRVDLNVSGEIERSKYEINKEGRDEFDLSWRQHEASEWFLISMVVSSDALRVSPSNFGFEIHTSVVWGIMVQSS